MYFFGLAPLDSNTPFHHPRPSRSSKRGPTKDLAAFAPISAADYFAQALSVAVPSSALDFRVYYSPPTSTKSPTTTTCLICHHGAGYSGLTFACFAKEVARISNGELGVLAFDARSHGQFLLFKEENHDHSFMHGH